MDIIFIISLIIFVFLAALIIILIKKILKIIFFISILLLVFILGFGFFIYQDAEDIKEHLMSNRLFLLVDEGEILTGVIIIGDETVFIDENQIDIYSGYLQDNDYDSLLADNYRLFLVSLDILNELEDEYEILDKTITKKELFDIFRSETPFKTLAGREPTGKVTINGDEIEEENKIKFKGYLFMTILANDLIKAKNPFKMLIYYKKDYLIVYPETILFKFAKNIPTSFVNKISAKVTYGIEKVKEKTNI